MHEDNQVDLAITCEACGANESRDIDWLRQNAILECSSCGNQINLGQEPWKGQIHRLWNASHHLGPPRRKLP